MRILSILFPLRSLPHRIGWSAGMKSRILAEERYSYVKFVEDAEEVVKARSMFSFIRSPSKSREFC